MEALAILKDLTIDRMM